MHDPDASNHDPTATEDDGSCTYPADPVLGCTDVNATNYNAAANEDDGTCQYATNPEDPCAAVSCDACPDGWTVLPADDGECCPSCVDPSATNQTDGSTNNGTNQTNGTSTNETGGTGETRTGDNETNMQLCDLCCGETYEHPANEPCPVAMCEPCEEDEATTSTCRRTPSGTSGRYCSAVGAGVGVDGKKPTQDELGRVWTKGSIRQTSRRSA